MLDFNNFNDDEKTEFKPEPVLIENNKRFVLFPIQYNDIWQAYKSLESKFWTAEDVELSDDVQGFHDLQGKAKSHVLQCLSLVLVNSRHQNIPYQLSSEIQVPEARCFYGFEIMQTSIHQELAGLMMDQLTKDQQELRNDTVDLVATCNYC
jgi:ribonucleotide reductase beta subunit family protein with ferritin-like domain